MKTIISFIFILYTSFSFGQKNKYQNLIDSGINKNAGLFVHSKPISIDELDIRDLRHYYENVDNYSNKKLNTIILKEIIGNCKFSDTTEWTDEELSRSYW